jgi:alkanesulfonate monooxygenase SsuD/methylene tetrahydromethanopterin reductase-like flavin-dependent oxidoreductase (luciferase family)
VKVGLMLPLFSGDASKVVAAGRDAEALGFDGVFGFDHFFPPGAPPDRPSLEVFTSLASVGAVTERVAVGTLVTRSILRPPGMVAKLASTIDVITGGRMILAMGTGDPANQPEHDVFGFPNMEAADLREHLAETVTAVRALFRGDRYEGGARIGPVEGPLLPPPARPGGPPVWVGGLNDDTVRLAGSVADGWNGWGVAPSRFRRKASLLVETAGALGREVEATWAGVVVVGQDEAEAHKMSADRAEKGIMGDAFSGSTEQFVEFLGELSDARATWSILMIAGPADRRRLIAERVLPALA